MAQSKEEVKKIPAFNQLPKHLQKKYKNSILFEKENRISNRNLKFDAEKLRQRKIDKQKTIEEKLQEFTLNPTEEKRLREVFREISGEFESFGKQQIIAILKKMKTEMSLVDINLMIWQFDQDLDGRITFNEFERMYKMCMMDKSAAEPKKLFHLTQYLMYCTNGCYEIIPENTYELEYIRANDIVKNQIAKGSNNKQKQKQVNTQQINLNISMTNIPKVKEIFEESIKTIFGNDYENDRDDGIERTITFKTYLEKKTKKAIENRREAVQRTKTKLKTLKIQ